MQLPIRKQRELLLQLLFSWEVSKDAHPVELLMKSAEVSRKQLLTVAMRLEKLTLHIQELDEMIKKASTDYALDRISLIDKNILRLALFELVFEKQEAHIVVEEALRLSKKFSSPEAVSYVHAIIDEVQQHAKVVLST